MNIKQHLQQSPNVIGLLLSNDLPTLGTTAGPGVESWTFSDMHKRTGMATRPIL